MMRVLTDTYPASVKPVRGGWYLTQIVDGHVWILAEFAAGSWRTTCGELMALRVNWRGLAFDPARAFDHHSWHWVEPKEGHPGGYEQGVFIPGAEIDHD